MKIKESWGACNTLTHTYTLIEWLFDWLRDLLTYWLKAFTIKICISFWISIWSNLYCMCSALKPWSGYPIIHHQNKQCGSPLFIPIQNAMASTMKWCKQNLLIKSCMPTGLFILVLCNMLISIYRRWNCWISMLIFQH